jgi:hypothetical protein
MRRRRWGLPRYTWWLLLILGLGVAPVIASAFLALGMVVLGAAVGIAPGVGPGVPDPAPVPPPAPPAPPPPGAGVQLRITVEGDGEVYASPPGSGCSPGQTCIFDYQPGDQISLGAVPGFSPGSNARFVGWDGDCARLGREQYPTLVMDASKNCVARFTPP